MKSVLVFLFLAIFNIHNALADPWALPLELNENNTSLLFEVDSTWHLIHGQAKQVSGKLWFNDPRETNSLLGNVRLEVERLDSDNSSRDKRMREVMAANLFPIITYNIEHSIISCPQAETINCSVNVRGSLSIRGVSKPFELTGNMNHKDGYYEVQAKGNLNWMDFGIEDPSILVAKLNTDVKILLSIRWR